MSCFDCQTRIAARRVDRFLKSGGKRLYLPTSGGFSIATIVERVGANELRLRDQQGREFEASACRIPLIAFAGVT
jgi:hypothetical protein